MTTKLVVLVVLCLGPLDDVQWGQHGEDRHHDAACHRPREGRRRLQAG
jgi:hypothetical protein